MLTPCYCGLERYAWTGGDVPQDYPGGNRAAFRNPTFRQLVAALMREQLADWLNFWSCMPDADTAHIFAIRATGDAWRTLYPRGFRAVEV